ncbi:MAG TPA: GNAT family N-acetyltransferase [Mycobacteriales bacterium]|nr:GNAT family N-acetyltransferase [Mycobacteriales bacterium]
MPSTSAVVVLDDAAARSVAARDPLTAQNLSIQAPGTEVFALRSAVAVHQRLGKEIDDWCVTGAPADAALLFRRLVSAGSHSSASLPWAAAEALQPELAFDEVERWDFRWTDAAPPLRSSYDVAWLEPAEHAEVQSLLDAAFPTAALQTADQEVRRWAGLRDGDGRLAACAADATTASTLGFIASIGCALDARGRGYGAAVTAWTTAALVAEHGRAGLWVYHSNLAARRVYDLLGYRDDHRMAWVSMTPPPATAELDRPTRPPEGAQGV